MILFLAGMATGAMGIMAVGYLAWRAEQRKLREQAVQATVDRFIAGSTGHYRIDFGAHNRRQMH